MRVVVDTNVLISALLKADGSPAKIVSLWRSGELELVVSEEVVSEVSRVLGYQRIRTRVSAEEAERFLDLLRTAALAVTAYENVTVVKDDPDDDKFLAIAIVSGAEYIISGDTHLLSIGNYQGIEILTPADFLTNILPNTTKTE